MAGRGPVPKGTRQDPSKQKRREASTRTLTQDGVLRGPELPARPEGWHPETLNWWETWRLSPQAQLFEDTDWEVLKRAALLHDYVWTAPKPSAAAISELRLIEERMGATYADRQRARIHISHEEAEVVELRPVGGSIRDRMKKGQEGQK